MVSIGTREAAFVYALSAAAISHTIAQACTSGDLRLCSCAPIPSQVLEPGYRWGGCADNLHYGLMMGSKFADAPLKMKRAGSHANKLMHLHNSEVGRQVSSTQGAAVSGQVDASQPCDLTSRRLCAGAERFAGDEVQVPRSFWLLLRQNLLERPPGSEGDRR